MKPPERPPLPASDPVTEAIRIHTQEHDKLFTVELKKLEGANRVNTILKEARTGAYDLIILGAIKHLIRGRLFFGHTVEELSQQAPCPLIIVTPRQGGMSVASQS